MVKQCSNLHEPKTIAIKTMPRIRFIGLPPAHLKNASPNIPVGIITWRTPQDGKVGPAVEARPVACHARKVGMITHRNSNGDHNLPKCTDDIHQKPCLDIDIHQKPWSDIDIHQKPCSDIDIHQKPCSAGGQGRPGAGGTARGVPCPILW